MDEDELLGEGGDDTLITAEEEDALLNGTDDAPTSSSALAAGATIVEHDVTMFDEQECGSEACASKEKDRSAEDALLNSGSETSRDFSSSPRTTPSSSTDMNTYIRRIFSVEKVHRTKTSELRAQKMKGQLERMKKLSDTQNRHLIGMKRAYVHLDGSYKTLQGQVETSMKMVQSIGARVGAAMALQEQYKQVMRRQEAGAAAAGASPSSSLPQHLHKPSLTQNSSSSTTKFEMQRVTHTDVVRPQQVQSQQQLQQAKKGSMLPPPCPVQKLQPAQNSLLAIKARNNAASPDIVEISPATPSSAAPRRPSLNPQQQHLQRSQQQQQTRFIGAAPSPQAAAAKVTAAPAASFSTPPPSRLAAAAAAAAAHRPQQPSAMRRALAAAPIPQPSSSTSRQVPAAAAIVTHQPLPPKQQSLTPAATAAAHPAAAATSRKRSITQVIGGESVAWPPVQGEVEEWKERKVPQCPEPRPDPLFDIKALPLATERSKLRVAVPPFVQQLPVRRPHSHVPPVPMDYEYQHPTAPRIDFLSDHKDFLVSRKLSGVILFEPVDDKPILVMIYYFIWSENASNWKASKVFKTTGKETQLKFLLELDKSYPVHTNLARSEQIYVIPVTYRHGQLRRGDEYVFNVPKLEMTHREMVHKMEAQRLAHLALQQAQPEPDPI